MREVKFRAWDNEDNKMWKVVSITESIWGDCEETHIRVCEFHENPSKKETDVRMSVDYKLMQYTGRKDKNGVEIYEGDILKALHGSKKGTHTVVWRNNGFYIQYDFNNRGYDEKNVIPLFADSYVVIGNIYEHPELLGDSN